MANSTQSSGIGFFGLLQVVFIVLKVLEIGKVASWSWWIVFLPTFIPLGILALIGLIVIFVYAVGGNK